MAKKVDFMAGFNQATQQLPVSAFSEQEKIKSSLRIVDDLKRFIPPLSAEEYEQLETNILVHGCKDPITIWETTENIIGASDRLTNVYVILDGHNRYEICKKHQVDFKISAPLQFESIDTAKEFMINHQLGRRNLNTEQISYFRGLRYLALKQEKGKYSRNDHNGKSFHYENSDADHNDKSFHYGNSDADHNGKSFHYDKATTAQELAKEFNVSEKTIRNDALFANSVEQLPPEIRTEVLQGKSTLTKAELIGLSKTKTQVKNSKDTNKQSKQIKTKISMLLAQNTLSLSDYKDILAEIKTIIKKIEETE